MAVRRQELMGLPEVEAITTLSGPHIHLLSRKKKFPQKVKLGRRTAWVRYEVEDWIAAKVAASRPTQARSATQAPSEKIDEPIRAKKVRTRESGQVDSAPMPGRGPPH